MTSFKSDLLIQPESGRDTLFETERVFLFFQFYSGDNIGVYAFSLLHLLDIVSNQFNTHRMQADVYLTALLMASDGEREFLC